MSERTAYPQIPFLVATSREVVDGRTCIYHTYSDGRVVGYWSRRDPDTGVEQPAQWRPVAPPVPDHLIAPLTQGDK